MNAQFPVDFGYLFRRMKQQHFLRPRWVFLALACLCASHASANSERHPPARVEGRILTLNGEAIRTVWGFQVYRVSLYLENRNQNAKSIMEHDKGAKRVRMEMLRGVDSPSLTSAVRESIARNMSASEQRHFSSELSGYLETLRLAGDVRAGQVVTIDYSPSKGTVLALDGRPLATIAGHDFYHAMLRVWIANPPQPSIRSGLLAGG